MNLLDKGAVECIRAANTHCHHLTHDYFEDISLHKLMQMSYISWILPDQGDTPEGHRAYFDLMACNSYFFWWKKGVERLYSDGDELTAETWNAYDERIRKAYECREHDIRLLKNECGYDFIMLDDYKAPGCDHGAGEVMRPIFRCDMFLCGNVPSGTDENGNSAWARFENKPDKLSEYETETEKVIRKAVKNGSVGLKIAIAYERSIHFSVNGRALAEKAFLNETACEAESRAFGDHMMNIICEIAANLNVPLQIHTGLGILSDSRAIGLRDLIHEHPNTKFDIFHASYPWTQDVLGLAHNYKNVYADLCWLPLISTHRAKSFLRETLELIDAGRILWGCDTWTSEESMGARMAAHECILETLNDMIREGRINFIDGERIASRILRENAVQLFRLS